MSWRPSERLRTHGMISKVRPMELRLYNNRTREKQVFRPQKPDLVTMYVCGPTVYGPVHIGNARPAVVFDVLAGLLRQLYPKLVYARNITDIDDKINAKAHEAQVDISEISQKYTLQYHSDMNALGVQKPDIEPFATQHIADIQAMIETLIARGHAYIAEGHVLFDVSSDPDYGSLSRRQRDELIAGARVDIAPYKKNPEDFVLWKPSEAHLPGWQGLKQIDQRGRPGWHIECSAMIAAHFGATIDIHGGGIDLQFPHHENECAQSRCAHGAPLAQYWLHNGMLNINGEKMSKSRGNVALIMDLLTQYPGEVIRMALLQGHYRQPMDFNDKLLDQSKATLDRLYGLLRDCPADILAEPAGPCDDAVMEALCDDLNTPKALAALSALSKQVDQEGGYRRLLAAGRMLGLFQHTPESWFQGLDAVDADRVEALVAARAQARAAKDFAAADAARDELTRMGITIEDTPQGTLWRLAR